MNHTIHALPGLALSAAPSPSASESVMTLWDYISYGLTWFFGNMAPAGVWVLVGLAVGYAVNFILRNEKLARPAEDDHDEIHAYSCGREHEGKSNVKVYFVAPLLHSLKIALYIFIVTLVFGYIFEYNEQAIISSFVGGPYVEPLITAAIGLIPNCASSAVIAQTFCEGGILFGSMVAGLCCNAGLGFVVLLKNTKKIKRNLLLIVTLYVISVLVGIAVNGIMIAAGLA